MNALSITRERAGVFVAVFVVLALVALIVLSFFYPDQKLDQGLLATLTALASGGFVWLTGKQTTQPEQPPPATGEAAEKAPADG